MQTTIRTLIISLTVLAVGITCAHHPKKMESVRMLMASQGYRSALDEFDKMSHDEDDVLYLLEWGLLLHYAGEYAKSNDVFERAEILTEDLYTKSISREAAALVTSDLVLEYVPKPYEQVLVNYFRALNYIFLDDKEGALVECRKAVDKLVVYSEEDKRPYRRDAFMEYLTGMLYEWDGDVNDAFISYRNAVWGFWIYEQRFGIPSPPYLICDVRRTAEWLGFSEAAAMFDGDAQGGCGGDPVDTENAKVVIFLEQGFIPARQQWSVNVPILKSEAKEARARPYDFSIGVHDRVRGTAYDAGDVAYFLRVALPVYPERNPPPAVSTLALDGVRIESHLCEDVFAIAKAELGHDMPRIVAKTLARALIKYKATDKIEESYGKIWGTIANIASAGTEQADLRGWLSLPRAIHVGVAYVAPGVHRLTAAPAGPYAKGQQEAWAVDIEAQAGSTNFVRIRVY